jgi:hypothetical protein
MSKHILYDDDDVEVHFDNPKNVEGGLDEYINKNKKIKIGDTIDYKTDNQENSGLWKVIKKGLGKKGKTRKTCYLIKDSIGRYNKFGSMILSSSDEAKGRSRSRRRRNKSRSRKSRSRKSRK